MADEKIKINRTEKVARTNNTVKRRRPLAEKIAEEPAILLEKTISESKKIVASIENNEPVRKIEEYWHLLGPGLTTGAADDDPSGIATYSQAGARYGFQWLWLASFTFPLMAIAQEMCARIGLVTGRGLAANIKKHFSPRVLYFTTVLLFAANTFNIGADLGAMSQVTRLIFPNLNFGFLVIFFAITSLLLQIFTTYQKYARYLKWLALVLLSYVFTAMLIEINWKEVAIATFIPHMTWDKDSLLLVTGILGTTISPYLFFWQTSQEVEEEILQGKTKVKDRIGASDQEIKEMRLDIWSGMFLSNLVMFFIISTCSATLHAAGITNIASAADAASALRPLAGDNAYLLFAIGVIGTGLLAIPVLAGSVSYALSEAFGWREGLYNKLSRARAFYGVIIISVFVGLLLNFIGLDPIKALIYSAVANGLVAPVVLTLIVLISGNKEIMGHRANGSLNRIFGWLLVIFMSLAGLATIISLF
ncbi:divalent metal cation transporter [Candidatus Falkowbacteria bacterium]|nr:divalent metal cation transporter [Candidatus Falkowbacteria bacterium]